ncbi:MAG: HDOD domain-containing protein, partial [Gammaproteobacteria bacterium]|nr:HDOD domain-containing protein [Gammaproteobacteria bacterium]
LAFDTGNVFKLPSQGPIGLQAIWRQSLFCAALTQQLAGKVAPASQPSAGMMYMAGLLHNIGFLLLGHLFKEEFNVLNANAEKNKKMPIAELEERLLGMSHTEIGVWLMREWLMPAELIVATFEHHNPNYRGQHFVYPNLILIANRLLKRHGIGDEFETDLPKNMLIKLGLDETIVLNELAIVMRNQEAIDSMVQELHS